MGETRSIRYYALLPDRAGEYTLGTEIRILRNGTDTPFQELGVGLGVDRDAATMASDLIAALNALPVSGEDRERVHKAVGRLEKVRDRVIVTPKDAEKNIRDILKAIDALLPVPHGDIPGIRLVLDDLLEVWQGEWYRLNFIEE